MATLLDLTSQGDVATITDDAYLNRTLQLMNPQQLYELWERQQWQSQAIDLERDKEHGPSCPRTPARSTLGAQLVLRRRGARDHPVLRPRDGVRGRAGGGLPHDSAGGRGGHMQFFDRWFREVAGVDGDIRQRLAASRKDVTDAFVELFDERLVKMGERLIAEPGDMDAKVEFVTTYHMVIEGTLALTGQHFMLGYYEKTSSSRLRRGLREHRARRAPPRGLRHLVPAAEVRRGALPRPRAGDAERAAAARGGRAGAEGLRVR